MPVESTPPPRLFERVRLVVIQPQNYPHSHAFAEIIESLGLALSALGSRVDFAINQWLREDGVNFIFGAHLLPSGIALPQDTVIVNLEQMRATADAYPHYIELLGRHAVLDYSTRNAERIRQLTGSPRVCLFKVGAVPALTRIPPATRQDVDVLFYGAITDRRRQVLQGLVDHGLAVKALFGVYGRERDAWIARSKIVLNLHHHEDSIHEVVRTSYLLVNRKAVVSEYSPDTEIDPDVRAALVAVPRDKIIETCIALARDDARRHAVEHRAFDLFTRRDQAALLAEALPELSRSVLHKSTR